MPARILLIAITGVASLLPAMSGTAAGAVESPCVPGSSGGTILFEIRAPSGDLLGCTPGPEPVPPGVELAATESPLMLRPAEEEGSAPCIGDGLSGPRVQAIYAYPGDRPSRYAEVAPLIRSWAGSNVDAVVNDGAVATGGTRHVRFVTDASCQVVVEEVALSASGDDTFANTIVELQSLGFVRPDRKYLVWLDAAPPAPYCGIAQIQPDDRPDPANANNGPAEVPGMVARIDPPCWGNASYPVEAHELLHTLGAVQASAPHAGDQGHCLDEYDVMCTHDGGSDAVACPGSERVVDCNHDDYFHTQPPAGSYLADHWNVADSSFLEDLGPLSPEQQVCAGTEGGLSLRASRHRVARGSRVRLRVLDLCGIPQDGWVLLDTRPRPRVRAPAADLTTTFRFRVHRRMVFRAFAFDQHGVQVAGSNRVTVRVRR